MGASDLCEVVAAVAGLGLDVFTFGSTEDSDTAFACRSLMIPNGFLSMTYKCEFSYVKTVNDMVKCKKHTTDETFERYKKIRRINNKIKNV